MSPLGVLRAPSALSPEILGAQSDATEANLAEQDDVVTLTASYTDDATDIHTAVVDWGDGSLPTQATIVQIGDLFAVEATHAYQDGGIYPISLMVMDESGSFDTETTTAIVSGAGVVNGVLHIIGTQGNDTLEVTDLFGVPQVVSSFDEDFQPAILVDNILVQLFGGDDTAFISSDITSSVEMDGGRGIDEFSSDASIVRAPHGGFRVEGTDIIGVHFEFLNGAEDIIATGSGPGIESMVRVTGAVTEELKLTITPYPGFLGGVRVATADVNGDGVTDIITGAGPGGGPHIKVFDGVTDEEVRSFMAFDPRFKGGVFVAAADLNQDRMADIIVGADAGGGPHVRVFSGNDGSELSSFFAYNPAFTGGVRVAAGEITGDGTPDIITAAGAGGGPHVRFFDGAIPHFGNVATDIGGPLGSFYAYDPNFTGGVFVAAGDVNGDLHVDLITAAGTGGGPHVRVFDGRTRSQLAGPIGSFMAYDIGFTGGVRVAASDVNGDGLADIITGAGPGGGPHVKAFNSGSQTAPETLRSFFAYDSGFTGGVFVAGSTNLESTSPSLRLADGINSPGDAPILTLAEAQPILDAALVRLHSANPSKETNESLAALTLHVEDLKGDLLAEARPGAIALDINPAGVGWFVDPTPFVDEEFAGDRINAISRAVVGRIDLLTVLHHELGHHLGARDLDAESHPNHVMTETLAPGRRRLPDSVELDMLFSDLEFLDAVFA